MPTRFRRYSAFANQRKSAAEAWQKITKRQLDQCAMGEWFSCVDGEENMLCQIQEINRNLSNFYNVSAEAMIHIMLYKSYHNISDLYLFFI